MYIIVSIIVFFLVISAVIIIFSLRSHSTTPTVSTDLCICEGSNCGMDTCGNENGCGTCQPGYTCQNGTCVCTDTCIEGSCRPTTCSGLPCECPQGQVCGRNWQCCVQNICPDGADCTILDFCGLPCACPDGTYCHDTGQCS
jgi:hypothetical protein